MSFLGFLFIYFIIFFFFYQERIRLFYFVYVADPATSLLSDGVLGMFFFLWEQLVYLVMEKKSCFWVEFVSSPYFC